MILSKFIYIYYGKHLKLENWKNVSAGGTVTGSITISNAGAAGSTLNWEVESVPDWGDWILSPDGGTGLTDPINVDVSVIAPSDKQTTYTGELKIINSDNPDDFAIIQCHLATPKVKMTFIHNLVKFFPILRNIFGI